MTAERDHTLTALLEEKLPQYPASLALKRRLAENLGVAHADSGAAAYRHAGATARMRSFASRAGIFAPLAVAASLVAVLLPLALRHRQSPLAAEAVGDHLRVLEGELPLQIVSSGIHEVKPWFAGKLDFAPSVPWTGDADFALQGGAVARFLDRRAALLVYTRREHRISLLVVRPEGLDWPASSVHTLRGFHLMMWRSGDLGYALVSDLDAQELAALAAKVRQDR
jgi:anti-sigma factor RsiW